MPTMGLLKFFFSGLARTVWRKGLERADFLRINFARETGEPLFGVRLAAIALIMLIPPRYRYKLRFDSRISGQFDFILLQPFAFGAPNYFMRGGFPQGQMQRHSGARCFHVVPPGRSHQDSCGNIPGVSVRTRHQCRKIVHFRPGAEPTLAKEKRSSSDGGYAFLDKVPLDFPISQ